MTVTSSTLFDAVKILFAGRTLIVKRTAVPILAGLRGGDEVVHRTLQMTDLT